MTIRVAINGYGRIGRNILRAPYESGKSHPIEIVAINDLGSAEATQAIARGGYVLADAEGGAPALVLIATGSEVALAVAAREKLAADGIRVRVVSMPSTTVALMSAK